MREKSGCTPGGRTAASTLFSLFFSLKKPGSAGSSSSQSCANQAGWVAAETGRQPWIVYGILRTKDALSPSVSGGQVLGSIIMFSCIYGLLLLIWLYVLDDKIRSGPEMPSRAPGGSVTEAKGAE